MNIFDYLSWHFSIAPLGILKLTRNLLLFTEHYFGISLHLRTLLYPWKRQIFISKPGFNLSNYFETVVSNLISSILGALVRLALISIGLVAQITTLLFGFTILIVFVLLPFVTLPLYYSQRSKESERVSRKKALELFSQANLPNLSLKDVKKFSQTKAGSFLFNRLTLPQKEVGQLSLTETFQKYAVKKEHASEILRWYCHSKDEEEEYSQAFSLVNMLKIPTLGRDWAYGYSIEFDKYTRSMVEEGYDISHLIGRQKELEQIKLALARNRQKNALLVGNPGSGRHALILAFALDVFENKAGSAFNNREVVELSLNVLVSEAKVETEVKGKVTRILEEAVKAGNKIIVIDNFDRFVSGEEGAVNLSDVFLKLFASIDIQLIGICTNEAFHKHIAQNSDLVKLFEIVKIEEISTDDTLKILEHLVPTLEKNHQVYIPFSTLTHTLEAAKTITQIPFPEKAIDILSQAALLTKAKKMKIVTQNEINQIVTQKTKIPLGALEKDEKEILKNIENLLKEQVIGQDIALEKIAQSLRRSRLNITSGTRPIGTFLFIGPTGVGKTETAKALARTYFGSEKQMLRIDMNQYQGPAALSQLLGDTSQNTPGHLSKMVRDNPFAVLLLDEIEKASPEVLNLLLTILDEGYITDSFGRRVSFEHTIIITTSNAASEDIRQMVEKGQTDNLDQTVANIILTQHIFSPELLNRFDAVVVYKPLNLGHLKQIALLLLGKLNKQLEEKRLKVAIDDHLINLLATEGYNPQFGARPMRRVLQEKVEDYIAQGVLENKFRQDEIITIPAL